MNIVLSVPQLKPLYKSSQKMKTTMKLNKFDNLKNKIMSLEKKRFSRLQDELKTKKSNLEEDLKEIDVIIMTYRKLGNEIRYNEVYFARKTNLHRKPIITASFPYIESFEPNLNTNSSSHWYALLSKKKVGKFIKDNMKGRRRLSNTIVTPKRFEEYPTDVDIDCFNCIDFLNFDIEFLLNYE